MSYSSSHYSQEKNKPSVGFFQDINSFLTSLKSHHYKATKGVKKMEDRILAISQLVLEPISCYGDHLGFNDRKIKYSELYKGKENPTDLPITH